MISADNEIETGDTAAYHDAYAADYDSQVKDYGCHIEDVLFGLCYEYIQPAQALLDLGIGSGLSAIPFVKAGLQVYGMDFSPAMLDVCRRKGIAVALKLQDIRQSPWPYESGQFDHLICCGVLHFLPGLETVFAESVRLLRQDGIFAFTSKVPLSSGGDVREYEQTLLDGIAVYAHSKEYLLALLEQHSLKGLKLLKCYVGEDAFYAWVTQKVTG